MKLDDEKDDVIVVEPRKKPKTKPKPEPKGSDEDTGDDGSYVDEILVKEWEGEDLGDPEALEEVKRKKAKARAEYRKTNKSTGNLLLNLIAAILFSPFGFRDGLEILQKYINLGKREPGQPRQDAAKLYQRKKQAFWSGILKVSFLKPILCETAIGLILGSLGIWLGIRALNNKGFGNKTFGVIVLLVAFFVTWVIAKSILRSVLGVMDRAYCTVMEAKKNADKKKAAQEEQVRKQQVQAAREARKRAKPAKKEGKKEPPSAEGKKLSKGRTRRTAGGT